MNPRIIRTIIAKDLGEFLRNRFFVFMTVMVLVAWIAVFWLLPDSVDETLTVGVHLGGVESGVVHGIAPGGTGLAIAQFATTDELRRAVAERTEDVVAGIDVPSNFAADVAAGRAPTVQVYVPAAGGADIALMIEALVGDLAFVLAGPGNIPDPVLDTTVLGVDRIGDQVSLQEQMRPVLLVVVLMVETFALSSLVAIEVQQRTVVALLATPATVADVLAAKGLFGTALAFVEAMLLAVLIGALSINAPLVVLALLLGSVLVTGFGLLAGAFGKDFLGTLVVAMVFMIPLMVPAFGALFPGSTATWIKMLPTYGLVDVIIGTTAYGEGWAEAAGTLLVLAGWGVAGFVAGTLTLRRRVVTL